MHTANILLSFDEMCQKVNMNRFVMRQSQNYVC